MNLNLEKNTALILIDIQNDYFPGGSMALDHMDQAAIQAQKLLAQFRKDKLPIAHIQHIATRPNATFFLPESFGAEIHESVRPLESEQVLIKHYPNSFRETDLDLWLKNKNIKNLIIAGAMSHMCIDTTVRAAFDLGYKNTVIFYACATKDLSINGINIPAAQVHAAYMAGLNGLFAQVVS